MSKRGKRNTHRDQALMISHPIKQDQHVTDHPSFVERQAECATMLVAIAKILLCVDTHDFVVWLRLVADDIEAKGMEKGLDIEMAANDDGSSTPS